MSGNNAAQPPVFPLFCRLKPPTRRPSRDAECARDFSRTPPKQRGARDAGDLPVPTVWCGKGEAPELSSASAGSDPGIPHAMVFGLLRANPGGVTRPSFWERPLYPPLAGLLTGAIVFGTRKAPDPEDPVARGQRAGHRTAWAAETRVRRTLRPPRPRSASRNRLPEGAPLVSGDE